MRKGFGIIGCGHIAPRHAAAIQEIEAAELVAVADIVEERASQFASAHQAQPYFDYRELLADPGIDIVNICTPNGLHAAMTLEAFAAGKHVIVEKPMAIDEDEASTMIAAARNAHRKLCVVLQTRYNPPLQDLYDVIRQGVIGRILLACVTVRWFRPQSYYEDGWHGTRAMDGGVLMNQCIHHVDALQWLMGEPVVELFAFAGTLGHQMEADDTAVATLRFESGALATIEGSTITFPHNLEASIAVFGQRGSLKVGGNALDRKVFWKIDGELEREAELLAKSDADTARPPHASHRRVIEDMLEAIQSDREPATGGSEAIKSLSLVADLYESARMGKPVRVRSAELVD